MLSPPKGTYSTPMILLGAPACKRKSVCYSTDTGWEDELMYKEDGSFKLFEDVGGSIILLSAPRAGRIS